MKERRNGVVISVNLLISLLILLAGSYSAYVISTLDKRIEEQHKEIVCIAERLSDTRERMFTHLGKEEKK